MVRVEYMSLLEKKIKVLHVIDLSKMGGVEVMFMGFIEKIIKLDPKIEHEIFVLRISEERKELLSKLKVKTYLPKNNKFSVLWRLKISLLIWINKYDLVHGQSFSGNFWAAIGKIFQVKGFSLVCHEHGGSWAAEGFYKLASWYWAINSKLIICNSLASKTLIKKKIYQKAPCKVIYNGISLKNTKKTSKKFLKNFRILFVGRLEDIKGIKQLIFALKLLNKNNISFICNILGDGNLREWLEEYLKDNGLDKKVLLHGNVNNVGEFMGNSEVLIVPSLREPLGNVIIEAAHFNLPVIASKVDGIPEIVKNNHSGILIEPKITSTSHKLPRHVVGESGELISPSFIDPSELAAEILKLKNDQKLRNTLGLNANKSLKDFTIERYANDIRDAYLKIL